MVTTFLGRTAQKRDSWANIKPDKVRKNIYIPCDNETFVWTRKLLDFNRFKQQKNSKIIKTVFDGLKAFFLSFYLQRPINHA